MQTQHTIKKLVLDLTTNAKNKPYALQRKCSSLITEKFAPGAEQVFNRHFPDEDIITIRKIEIDLGDLSIDELDKELIHLCLQQLHTQLQQLKLQPSILAAETIQTKSRQQYLIEQFLQFLKTGRVQQSKMFTADWEMQLLVSVKENTTSFLQLLQTVLNNYPAAHERLVSQFHEHFIIELLLTAAPDIPREWFHIINLIKQNLDPPHHHLIRRKIILVMIRILFLADTLESSSFFVQLDIVVKNWNNETNETSKEAIAIKINMLADEWLHLSAATSDWLPVNLERTAGTNLDSAKPGKRKETVQQEDDNAACFIENAGLVLLHPFIETLFEQLHLTHEKRFIGTAEKNRATHLIQWMVTTERNTPEFLMTLNKLLCGVSADEHLERFVELTENEIKECHGLLSAVVEHWKALKNTSIQTLQQTFLQRRAKLSFIEQDQQWKLQVERKGTDILLDKLPWGFSYIQLPWMPYPLITEW